MQAVSIIMAEVRASPLPSLNLFCPDCKIRVDTKLEWKNHLLDLEHQSKARVNWGISTVIDKDCCLLVDSNRSFGKIRVLDLFFSQEPSQVPIVKNFLYWKALPWLSIVELESREDAHKAFEFSSKKASQSTLSLMQVTRAEEMSQLKWLSALPKSVAENMRSAPSPSFSVPEQTSSKITRAVTKRKFGINSQTQPPSKSKKTENVSETLTMTREPIASTSSHNNFYGQWDIERESWEDENDCQDRNSGQDAESWEHDEDWEAKDEDDYLDHANKQDVELDEKLLEQDESWETEDDETMPNAQNPFEIIHTGMRKGPENRIELLNQLVLHRGWKTPEYFSLQCGQNRNMYFWSVTVNGSIWAADYLLCDEKEAKRRISEQCRINLLRNKAPCIEVVERLKIQEIRNRILEESPLLLLEELAGRWRLQPVYQIQSRKAGARGVTGRVLINGVEWTRDFVSDAGKLDAKSQIAGNALNKIIESLKEWEEKQGRAQAKPMQLPEITGGFRGEEREKANKLEGAYFRTFNESNSTPAEAKRTEDKVGILHDLLKTWGWKKPVLFTANRTLPNTQGKTYFCRATVNGRVWAANYLQCETGTEAERLIAEECRINLLTNKTPSFELVEKAEIQEMETRVGTECPVKLLAELANRWALTPEYKWEHRTATVAVGKVTWASERTPPGKKREYQSIVALKALQNMISSLHTETGENVQQGIPLRANESAFVDENLNEKMTMLEHLVAKRTSWGMPYYFIMRTTPKIIDEENCATYFCRVTANGKVWAADYLKCNSEKEATGQIADQCRINILNGEAPTIQLIERSKLHEIQNRMKNEKASQLLIELATRWGIRVKYHVFVESEANGLKNCWCKVFINCMEWAKIFTSAATVEEVAAEAAEKALENVVKESEKDSRYSVVELPQGADRDDRGSQLRPSDTEKIFVSGGSKFNNSRRYQPKSSQKMFAKRGWRKDEWPKFVNIPTTRSKEAVDGEDGNSVFFCMVIANEKVWAAEYLKCDSKQEANYRIGEYFIINLLLDTPPVLQIIEKSQISKIGGKIDAGVSPVKLLEQLTRSWKLQSRYIITKMKSDTVKGDAGVVKYACKLVINQIKWVDESVVAASMDEARFQTALIGLNKIITECSNADEERTVALPAKEKFIPTRYRRKEGIEEPIENLCVCVEGEEAKSKNFKPELEGSCKFTQCSRKSLEELAAANGWNRPQYYSSKHVDRQNKGFVYQFSCRVVVNGVEYQPDRWSPRYQSRKDAVCQISQKCLEILSNSDSPVEAEEHKGTEFVKAEDCQQKEKNSEDGNYNFENIEPTFTKFPSSCQSSALFQEYQAIYKLVTLTNDDFKMQMSIVSTLGERLKQRQLVAYKVGLFKNWSLTITNSESFARNTVPIVYIYKPGNELPNNSEDVISTQEIDAIFDGSDVEEDNSLVFSLEKEESKQDEIEDMWKVKCKSKESCVLFTLISLQSENILEIQTRRLLEYLCTFDVRCHHLIAVAQYWASVNDIQIGEHDGKIKEVFCSKLNSLTLPYMVVVFLSSKEIIPTPGYILSQHHTTLIDPVSGEDVGFNVDPILVQNWTSASNEITRMIPGKNDTVDESIAEQVLQLFIEFLNFFCKHSLLHSKKILNVRDAEWIDQQKFLKSQPTIYNSMEYISNMSLTEIESLRELFQNEEKQDSGLLSSMWYMTNPFVVTCSFPVSCYVGCIAKLMRNTINNLTRYLSLSTQAIEKSDDCGNVEKLENALKIENDIKIRILDGKTANTKKKRRKGKK